MAFTKSFLKPPLTFPAVSGDVCSFVDKLGGFPLKAHEVSLVAKQAAGTPSPSSPLPISGWDAIHIQNTAGINQWDEEYLEGYYNSSGVFNSQTGQLCTKNKIAVNPNTNYYLGTSVNLIPSNTAICYYDNTGTIISRAFVGKGVFTTPSNCYYINVNFGSIYGGTYLNDLCINYPSTDTDYHAFEGQSFTIQIGSTVYGGTYNAITGILTVTHGFITYDGSNDENWTNVLGAFNIIISDAEQIQTPICNIFSALSSRVIGYLNDNECAFTPSGAKNLNFKYSSAADLTAWKSFLSDNNIQVCYELATPTTIQLSPAQILTLKNNNIWADTGATSLQYIKIGR